MTAGQVHDSKVFDTLLVGADECLVDGANAPIAWPITLCADKAYRADWIDRYLIGLGINPVIPRKETDNRNIVERLIGWLKECRRIFSRF